MKTNSITIFFLLVISLFLTNCATQRTSTIVGVDYNETKNETDYLVFPYGSVTIPGKWEKTNYNATSKQQFFRNQDSISIAIAFGRFDNYKFNTDGSKKGHEFIKAYYEWDSKYFVDSYGVERQLFEDDSTNNFIIYRIYGQSEKDNLNTYFLIGEKNGNISNFSIFFTDKWDEKEKIDFLKKLFLTKKEE